MSAARVHSIAEFDDWLRRGERGLSSMFIVEALTGFPLRNPMHHGTPDYPHDPADLRRCLLLIDAVPFLTDEIVEEAVRSSCPEWGVLAPALPVLRDMLVAEIGDYATVRRGARAPETYKHMRLLIEAARS